jgi:hypothetical protein
MEVIAGTLMGKLIYHGMVFLLVFITAILIYKCDK